MKQAMKQAMNLQLFAVDPNMIVSASLERVREVDFTERFSRGIDTLMNMLGVTRMIQKKAGEVLRAYSVEGTLEDGTVAEGAVIPLSKYRTKFEPIGEAELKKWRMQTTAEAISEKGFGQAVNDTSDKMVSDIQKRIRTKFVSFLATGTSTATGTGLQACMAQVWGQLQVLWEDTSINAVYFMNPLDIADYLGDAKIISQTAFGMRYIENFLGIGTVIIANDIPKGTMYATPVQNIVLYYIPVSSADMEIFDLTTDRTGLIGVHTGPTRDNMSVETVAASGVGLFAEQLAGVVVGTIDAVGA